MFTTFILARINLYVKVVKFWPTNLMFLEVSKLTRTFFINLLLVPCHFEFCTDRNIAGPFFAPLNISFDIFVFRIISEQNELFFLFELAWKILQKYY